MHLLARLAHIHCSRSARSTSSRGCLCVLGGRGMIVALYIQRLVRLAGAWGAAVWSMVMLSLGLVPHARLRSAGVLLARGLVLLWAEAAISVAVGCVVLWLVQAHGSLAHGHGSASTRRQLGSHSAVDHALRLVKARRCSRCWLDRSLCGCRGSASRLGSRLVVHVQARLEAPLLLARPHAQLLPVQAHGSSASSCWWWSRRAPRLGVGRAALRRHGHLGRGPGSGATTAWATSWASSSAVWWWPCGSWAGSCHPRRLVPAVLYGMGRCWVRSSAAWVGACILVIGWWDAASAQRVLYCS
jgi:hypothetical protein